MVPARTTLCRICDSALTDSFSAREMMLGLRDRFEYAKCPQCGAVQLCDPPENMARYYPPDYYAFVPRRRSGVRMSLRRIRNRVTLAHSGWLGKIAQRLKPQDARLWIDRTDMHPESRILDVGSGHGEFLLDLHEAGFKHLTGIDPYVDATTEPVPGVRIVKGELTDIAPAFDVVTFHHSLEHMFDQHGAMREAARLMAADGWCIVRIPIVSSYAWEHYGRDWVQLDAPRHVVLHSLESMTKLAAAAGLRLAAVDFDSTAFSLLGSELYRRDLPLGEMANAFSGAERREYRRTAKRLNAERRGDQAAFYFRKA
jgi:2-polyprenyl-3-methyl-5-hydroxy-6-metoxy-1,4-benzoquinol methylase